MWLCLATWQSYAVSSCLTSTDAHVVSGSEDGRVCFWDLVDGDMVTSIQAHTKVVRILSTIIADAKPPYRHTAKW